MRRRSKIDLIDSVITSAYEAVLHEESWGPTLAQLTALTGANSATHVLINGPAPEIMQTHALDPVVMQAYNAEFAEFDPFHGNIMRTPRSLAVHDRREVDDDFIRHSVWFQEFYRQYDIHSMMALPFFEGGVLAGSFNIQKAIDQGDFSDKEFVAMNAVAPHLVRATRLSAKMSALRRTAAYGNAVLDTLTLPILLLEQDGKVLLVNRAAEELIAREPALRLTQGQFAICENGGVKIPRITAKASQTKIERGHNRKPLHMTTLSLAPRSALNTSWQRPLTLIVFDDPDAVPVALNELLLTLFDMTPSEARVCIAIGCEGLSPQECADLFGVSVNTVRSQVRAIYAKTGAKRQSELVRILSMLNTLRDRD